MLEVGKVLIDTNILISAVLNPTGVPQNAIIEATTPPNQAILSIQTLEETTNTFQKKFPSKLFVLTKFLASILPFVTIVGIPRKKVTDEKQVRDIDDRTIYPTRTYIP